MGTKPIHIRIEDSILEVIDKAAALDIETRSNFIRRHAYRAALERLAQEKKSQETDD